MGRASMLLAISPILYGSSLSGAPMSTKAFVRIKKVVFLDLPGAEMGRRMLFRSGMFCYTERSVKIDASHPEIRRLWCISIYRCQSGRLLSPL